MKALEEGRCLVAWCKMAALSIGVLSKDLKPSFLVKKACLVFLISEIQSSRS